LAMRVLIVGCGYIGLPLGAELVGLGHEVFGLRRSAAAENDLKAAGIKALIADITRPEELARLPASYDWVVNCVSSTHGGVEEYRQVYLQGTRNLIEWLSPAFADAPARRSLKKFVYTSSTSVYGQTDGSTANETSATEPVAKTARVLVEAEQVLLGAFRDKKFPAVILRVAGIYGPARGHWLKLFLKGEAKLDGEGGRVLNMIHRDDVVGSIIAALENGRAGEAYNAVDDEPVTQINFFEWLAETLGKPLPPRAPEDLNEMGRRGVTSKRVPNRKLKMELGYRFIYMNFRSGYAAEIQRLARTGQLNIEL
jgi:nucleoside-diphosphate-sugar epimerase